MFYLLFLTTAVWLTYWHTIRSGFVSDDIEGLQNYDGKLKKFDYGHLNKWLLYKLLDKSPRRNHLFSIFLHNANVVLLFSLLSTFAPLKLAFFSSLLFAIHPICTQSVAWISGRGYPISLFFCLLGLNLVGIAKTNTLPLPPEIILAGFSILYFALYYISITAQHATLMTFILLAFFGNYFLAIIGAVISLVAGLGIVRDVVGIRTEVFKQQNLERSTKVNLKKIIVAVKSLGYYARLCLFPKRLGLYHTFCYHYDDNVEKEDKWFWLGFLVLLGFGALFVNGDFIVRFAVLWFISYIFVFLNWITVHQFVSERYAYIPGIGICVLVAYGLSYLDNLLFASAPVLMSLLVGIALMRTWAHLPTYSEEVSFYQSNVWNYPDSEVAFGNLGVVYMRCELIGSAMDMWKISLKINPNYDVAHYNIHSVLKQRGEFVTAKDHLQKAIASPQCHFRELWTKELGMLDHEIGYINELNGLSQQLALLERDPAKAEQARAIRKQLDEVNNLHKKFEESQKNNLTLIQQEENQLRARLVELERNKADVSKPIAPEVIISARDRNFSFVKETVNNMLKVEVKNESA